MANKEKGLRWSEADGTTAQVQNSKFAIIVLILPIFQIFPRVILLWGNNQLTNTPTQPVDSSRQRWFGSFNSLEHGRGRHLPPWARAFPARLHLRGGLRQPAFGAAGRSQRRGEPFLVPQRWRR